ncbi:hypothetical protein ACTA71_008569 [Dictyostelium dimigraforme]
MNDVSRIFPGFYIGSLPSVNRNTLDKYQITHVCSVLNEFQPKWTKIYKYLHIDIYDSPSVDIMKYFDKTFQFIEEGRKDGGVLVHCFAGISRSATICIAYIMRKLNISFEDAHGLVSDARPIIYPNESFIKQLKKYELILKKNRENPQIVEKKESEDEDEEDDDDDDDFDEDDEDESEDEDDDFDEEFDNVVKKKNSNNKKVNIKSTTKVFSNISISSEQPTPTPIPNPNSENLETKIVTIDSTTSTSTTITTTTTTTVEKEGEEESTSPKATLGQHRYSCRKCSKDLFLDFDILDHEQGQGQTSFKWNKRDNTTCNKSVGAKGEQVEDQNKIICTSYFISEIDFALSQTQSAMEGKLFCPSCNEKLGSWSWSGEQCSCGAWIAPSFQIPKTRVDEKKVLK